MAVYEHTQVAYMAGGVLGGGALLALIVAGAGRRTGVRIAATFIAAVLIVCVLLFSTLTVRVNGHALQFYFGPGIWKARIAIREIAETEVVHNLPWYGWGIHHTADGWLYNLAGLQAVEIKTKGGRTIRIGTDEPERLEQALEQAHQPRLRDNVSPGVGFQRLRPGQSLYSSPRSSSSSSQGAY